MGNKNTSMRGKALIMGVALVIATCFFARGGLTTSLRYASVKKIQLDLINLGSESIKTFSEIERYEEDSEPYAIEVVNGVTELESYIFENMQCVVKVSIPASVKKIEGGIFSKCRYLEYISVSPKNNYYCDIDGVLYDKDKTELVYVPLHTNIKSLKIPEGVKKFWWSDTVAGRGIKNITIPKSINEIGDVITPEGYQNLESIIVSDKNESYCSEDGVMYDKNKRAIICFPPASKMKSFTIPKTVCEIESWLASENLINLTIPENLLCIFERQGIENIIRGCMNLESITVTNQDIGKYMSQDGIVFENHKRDGDSVARTIIFVPRGKKFGTDGLYTIPDDITGIDSNAFSGCNNLHRINFDDKMKFNVIYIYEGAFKYCKSLKEFQFPNSEKKIRIMNEAFSHTGLENFILSNSVEELTIEDDVFADTAFKTDLKQFEIPPSVQALSIGDNLFSGSALEQFEIPPSVINLSIGNNAFANTALKQFEIPPSVYNLSIGDNAFAHLDLVTFKIPNPLTRLFVGESSFSNLTLLKQIELPYRVIYGSSDYGYYDEFHIPARFFEGCKNLEQVTILAPNTSNERRARFVFDVNCFSGCNSLKKLTLSRGWKDSNGTIKLCYIDLWSVFTDSSLESITYTGSEADWNSAHEEGSYFDENDFCFKKIILNRPVYCTNTAEK